MAFPEHKFEVLEWPPGHVEEGKDKEEEEEVSDMQDAHEQEEDNAKQDKKEKEEKSSENGNETDVDETAKERNVKMSNISKNEETRGTVNSNNINRTDNHLELSVEDSLNTDIDKEDMLTALSNGGCETKGPSSVDDRKVEPNTHEHVNCGRKIAEQKSKILSPLGAQKEETTEERNNIEKLREDVKRQQTNSLITDTHTHNNDQKKNHSTKKSETSRMAESSISDEHAYKKQEDESPPKNMEPGEQLNKSKESNIDPLIGATAFIASGPFKGFSGKIIEIRSRGWWTVDNPNISSKIHTSKCKLVDDGAVDMDAIKKRYASRGSTPPAIITRQDLEEEQNAVASNMPDDESETNDDESKTNESPMPPLKRKIASTDFTGNGTRAKQRKKELGLIVCDSTSAAAETSKISNTTQMQDENNKYQAAPKARNYVSPVLNPILLHPRGNDSHLVGNRNKQNDHLQLLPAGLRHLSPGKRPDLNLIKSPIVIFCIVHEFLKLQSFLEETKIKIFDRRTGKIIAGENAVLLSELSTVLMDHPEYEPIIPPSSSNSR